jgi:cell division protein FtsW
MPRQIAYDRWLFLTGALLVLGGLLMVGSSSSYQAMSYGKSASAYYVRQGLHLVLGFLVLVAAMKFPYQRLERRSVMVLLFVLCLVGLTVVLAMPEINGSRRWITLGPARLQPSEFVKLFVVVFMAYVLSRKQEQVNEFRLVGGPCLVAVGILAWLVLIEPDLGTAVLIVAVAGVMHFVAGLRWRTVGLVGALGILALAGGIFAQPYRLQRLKAFIDPASDALGTNYQLNQSLIAIGSGGWSGVGLGQGQQKALYIPHSHTDFIFSVIGEELGLIGTAALLVAFMLIFWRGLRAASRAPDPFGFYLAVGLTCLLVIQALVNMAVCLGMLPTKGLSLPLISYGGSSMLASMMALGLLLNVSQHSN